MFNSSLDNVTSGHYLRSAHLDYLMCNQVSIRVTEGNNNTDKQTLLEMTGKDASWILTSAVIIFTMQTGMIFNFVYSFGFFADLVMNICFNIIEYMNIFALK